MRQLRPNDDRSQKKNSQYLADLIKKDSVLNLNEDTYAMSFKALNY